MISSSLRILVTGACGSVGSSLIKRLLENGNIVCAFDQSEDSLFRLDQETDIRLRSRLRLFLGDVRDIDRLEMALNQIDIVFHCAALKHVYLSEYNPFEATKTNIDGVNNVIKASISNQVKKVIFTSSDKAVNPTSTMGATKLIGERLFIAANHYAGKYETKFSCVRFGNILNSNGSVLTIFNSQISLGKPLTITSKAMTRFFITMQDSVDLCLKASEQMIGGEVFVLHMCSADIMTLTKAISGNKSPEIIEIGTKPGEKLYEELVTDSEAKRTIKNDKMYVIIPEILDLMPLSIREKYEEYINQECIGNSLRSDQNLISCEELKLIIKSCKKS